MSSSTYLHLDNTLARIEKNFNHLGYIPLVSSVTGVARMAYGITEVALGKISGSLKAIQYLYTADREHRDQMGANFWYATHGYLNVNRGFVELVPVVGNIACFLYDHGFGIRANYTYEPVAENYRPIFDPSKAALANKMF